MKIYIDEIIKATNGKLIGNDITEGVYIEGVAIDSRDIKKGYLFVPNKTDKFDGEEYIGSAFENGAIATFISKDIENIDKTKYYIYVDSIREAFNNLAKYNRNKYNIPVIGITGSVGKTTAKEMIATVLEQKYNVLRTEGNFNSELGLPIMTMAIESNHEIAVLEMGTDHAGEMEILESIARPTDAVIMNIGVSHLEKFETRDNIYKDKSQIFKNINNKDSILLNIDNDILKTKKINAVWFGKDNKADIWADNIIIQDGFVSANVCYKDNITQIKIPGLSEHLIYPALAATYFGIKYGLKEDQIKEGLLKYKSLKMRMDIQKLDNGITVIDDTYNANPQSMMSAIDVLENADTDKKIAILGDMFELGDEEIKMHQDIGKYLNIKNISKVIAIGENMKYMYDSLDNNKEKYYFKTKEGLYENLHKIIKDKENTTILLKASRGMKFEDIIEKIEAV